MTDSAQELYNQRKLIATSFASPLASLIAKFVTYPIDTVKTMVQADRVSLKSLSEYKVGHSLELTKNVYKTDGIKGFFRGVTLASFGSIIAFSAYMTVYQRAKVWFNKFPTMKDHPAFVHLFSGFAAEFVSCAFWLPIDIIKQRMQVQNIVKLYKYNSPGDAMKKIHKTEGLIGLYRAFGATLVFFGPFSGLFFVLYEKIKTKVVKKEKQPTMVQSIICSSGASAIAGFLTTPLEIVKMRMQIQRADSAIKGIPLHQTLYGYRNIFHGLYVCASTQGFLALYKGGVLRILFVVPITTISVSLTEHFRIMVLNTTIPDKFL